MGVQISLWGTDFISFIWFHFLYTQRKDCWIFWRSIFSFLENFHTFSLEAFPIFIPTNTVQEFSSLYILTDNLLSFVFLILIWEILVISLPSWSLQSSWRTSFTHFKHVLDNIKQYIIKHDIHGKISDLEKGVKFVWAREVGRSFEGDLTLLITQLLLLMRRAEASVSNRNDLNSGSATSNKLFSFFIPQFPCLWHEEE